MNITPEQLNRGLTPEGDSPKMVYTLAVFKAELAAKKEALINTKAKWLGNQKNADEIFRTNSPRMTECFERYPLENLDTPDQIVKNNVADEEKAKALDQFNKELEAANKAHLTFLATISTWFKEHILGRINLELQPANIVLKSLVERFNIQVMPLKTKLRIAIENHQGWNEDQKEGEMISPYFVSQVSGYAIQICDIEIALIENVEAYLAHCLSEAEVGEKVLSAFLGALMDSVNGSFAKLILPNLDVVSSYEVILNDKIAPEEAMLEIVVAEYDALFAQTDAAILAAKAKSSQEAPIVLDDSAKKALLDNVSQFARRNADRKSGGVIASTPIRAPESLTLN